jgi:hypothetical protein
MQFNATVDTPTVATAAATNPSPVNGKTTNLSVLGADAIGEANLTYTWSATGPAGVTYSTNGTNGAKNTTATFTQAGTYTFTVTIMNPAIGTSVTSSVAVTVNQAPTGTSVVPNTAVVAAGATMQFVAGMVDQFGNVIGNPSAVTWSVVSGGGSVNASGVYTAGTTSGAATVRATFSGGAFSNATVNVVAPLAWYQADASSGTTLNDSSGNGNNGTLNGAAAFAPGVSGNALSLTGGNATLPNGIVSGLTNFTIAAWVNASTLASWDRIFDFGTGTTDNMFLTPDAGDTGRIRFAITTGGGGGEQQLNGPALTPNTWTQIAVTLSGSNATLYVNGIAVATNSSMTLNPASLGLTTQNYLGKSQYAADPALLGSIDDFRIYGTALSAQQIQQLADPAIVSAAVAAPNPVSGTSTALSARASDVTAGEAALTYTWSAVGTPPAAVSFSVNGTNAAKNTVATFSKAGTYNLQVAIDNPAADPALATISTVTVNVGSTLTSISVSPSSASIFTSQSQQFSATGFDQFGNGLAVQPTFVWSISSGSVGGVDANGLYTAPSSTFGSAVVQATSGTITATANVTVNWLKGDLNSDGKITAADVSAMMIALADLPTYISNRGIQASDLPSIADLDGNGIVTNRDLQALISLVANSQSAGGGSFASETVSSGNLATTAIPSAEQIIHSNSLSIASVVVAPRRTSISQDLLQTTTFAGLEPPPSNTGAPQILLEAQSGTSMPTRPDESDSVWQLALSDGNTKSRTAARRQTKGDELVENSIFEESTFWRGFFAG